jgi:hypothetical protein
MRKRPATQSKRPGRKIGAERRRVARETLRQFYGLKAFHDLPGNVRVAMLELCPREDN